MKKTAILIILTYITSFTSLAQKEIELNIGLQIGNISPELEYENTTGKLLKLSELRGKLVLIDFWASWCPPCRKENPNIVNAYKKYKNSKFKSGEGFEVYSVSLDKKKTKWINAIDKDNLSWKYHVSDLNGWNSDGANKYNIQSIPSNLLINSQGIIIAKNLKGIELHRFLDSQLK
tara:strand:+ start:51 stop:578 length:528 start_codon:yes stop_codon:yes gene_type:complete